MAEGPNGGPAYRLPRRGLRREFRRGIAISVLLTAAVVTVFLPINVPYSIDTVAQIWPAREWQLVRDPAGRLSGALYDRVSGATESYSFSQFEREDAIGFRLRTDAIQAQLISAGDTIGEVSSQTLNRQLAQLEGQLEVERASLALASSADKASVIEEAKQRIKYAEERVTAQTRIVARIRSLVQSKVASIADLEIEEDKLQLYRTEVDISRASLETVTTGARREQLALARARIAAMEQEIGALQNRASAYTVTTPIDGRVRKIASVDTLFIVSDAARAIALLPVQRRDLHYVENGAEVSLHSNGDPPYEATIVGSEARVRYVAGREMVVFTGLIDSLGTQKPIPGMSMRAKINCGEVTLREYIRRQIGGFIVGSGA